MRTEVTLYATIGISCKMVCAFSKEFNYSLNTYAETVPQEREMGGEHSQKIHPHTGH